MERDKTSKQDRESRIGESMLLFNNSERNLISAIRQYSAEEVKPRLVATVV